MLNKSFELLSKIFLNFVTMNKIRRKDFLKIKWIHVWMAEFKIVEVLNINSIN
jgi:hypothetical protein